MRRHKCQQSQNVYTVSVCVLNKRLTGSLVISQSFGEAANCIGGGHATAGRVAAIHNRFDREKH